MKVFFNFAPKNNRNQAGISFTNSSYISRNREKESVKIQTSEKYVPSLRSDFPTLKSTAVVPPSSLKAMWEGANPITHKL